MKKMKIEIWSDVMCPFCYIGKRNFEAALQQFDDADQIEILWKSFQLDATLPMVAEDSCQQYLVKRKGMNTHQVEEMLQQVTTAAKNVGLNYNFDQSIMVNTFKAHQLLQFAKVNNKSQEAEEILFSAYFIEGKDVADTETLVQLGQDMGLQAADVRNILDQDSYSDQVYQDIQEAQEIGVSGVPFFVLNRKYAVSGAQPPAVFLDVLTQAFADWKQALSPSTLTTTPGTSCTTDGICE